MAYRNVGKSFSQYVLNPVVNGFSFLRNCMPMCTVRSFSENLIVKAKSQYLNIGLFNNISKEKRSCGSRLNLNVDSNLPGVRRYSTKVNASETGRTVRSCRSTPEKFVQMLKKELNAVPTALKVDTNPRSVKTVLRKPSMMYALMAQKTKISAKGTRHQFTYPVKEPEILNLIKEDLLRIDKEDRKNIAFSAWHD